MSSYDRPFRFYKMHGLGNDFIFVLQESSMQIPSREVIARMCDRNRGIGADQLLWVEGFTATTTPTMHIFNTDGSTAGACGNATRCLAYLHAKKFPLAQMETHAVTIHTPAGAVACQVRDKDSVTIKLPQGVLGYEQVGGVGAFEPTTAPVVLPLIRSTSFVNVGNRHLIHVVDELPDDEVLTAYGQWINDENPCFPEGINVEFVRFDTPNMAQMRVYEKGAERITQACGTGACASVFAAVNQNMCARNVHMKLDGGDLSINVCANNQLEMTGPVCYVYEGVYTDGCDIR